jgi:hypothetical protein
MAQMSGYSWRHGEKSPSAPKGINHHMFADMSVKTLKNPKTWDEKQ